jgi:hypothetical protein
VKCQPFRDGITQKGFDHPKFSANASNLNFPYNISLSFSFSFSLKKKKKKKKKGLMLGSTLSSYIM